MTESLESMLGRLEQALEEQIEPLTALRAEALEEHAARGFHLLLCTERRIRELGEGAQLEALRPLLHRIEALLRRSFALLLGEQRRQQILIPALWPQAPMYGRTGRIDRPVHRSGGEDDRVC
jgi:hypothetical protein